MIIRYLLFLTILLCLPSCKTEKNIVTDSCQINGVNLELVQKGEETVLEIVSDQYVIEGNFSLESPCYFLRKNGVIQTFSYPDVNTENVIMVVGNLSSDKEKNENGINEKEICGNKIQGVLIKENKIIIPQKTLSGNITCKDFGMDEKNFWDMAH